MYNKPLGILLLIFPLLIILSFFLPLEYPELLFEFLLLIVSPTSFVLGIIVLIKARDKHKGFLSNKVSSKRDLIGKVILFGIICPVFIFFIGYTIYGLVDRHLRRTYGRVCNSYVSVPIIENCYEPFSKADESLLEPTLIGSYDFEVDEYIWRWDSDKEGYNHLNMFIEFPREYAPRDLYSFQKSWNLKNNYVLDIECDTIDVRKVTLAESETTKCTVSYNGEIVSNEVVNNIFCFYTTSNTCPSSAGIVLYSNPYSSGDEEYLFLLSSAGEDHSRLSVYRLDSGDYLPLMFKYEHNDEHFSTQTYTISGNRFQLYGLQKYGIFDMLLDGEMKLVTFFHEPTMGYHNNIRGIHSVWDVERDGLYRDRTVMELIENWEEDI